MKVLVTGANGFLANNIIRELNKRGVPVIGMVRQTSKLLSLVGATYEKVVGDVNNYYDLAVAVQDCDVIIHAAANTSQNKSHQLKSKDHVGTNNVIDIVEKLGLKKLIFVSSANTIGHGSLENPGVEDQNVKGIFRKSDYAVNKFNSQNQVLKAANEGRIRATVVNPSFMIGPYDAKPSSGKILLMYFNNRFAFIPPGGKSFIHVRDAAIAICNAIDKGRNGQCYLLTGENMTYGEFYRKIRNVTRISKPGLYLTSRLINVIGYIGSLVNKMGFSIELDNVNANILCIKNYYSSLKAIKELDMPQTPIEQAICESYEWFHKNGYLKRKN